MKIMISILGAIALLALTPALRAQEEEVAPKPSEKTRAAAAWDRFQERFDLNQDGKVSWAEYRKVQSGFARLDADRDGSITEEDFEKAPKSRRARQAPGEGRGPRARGPAPRREMRQPGPPRGLEGQMQQPGARDFENMAPPPVHRRGSAGARGAGPMPLRGRRGDENLPPLRGRRGANFEPGMMPPPPPPPGEDEFEGDATPPPPAPPSRPGRDEDASR